MQWLKMIDLKLLDNNIISNMIRYIKWVSHNTVDL